MVYFGPKRYRPSQRGLSRGEKLRVIGPILLLLTLFSIVIIPRFGDKEPPQPISGEISLRESGEYSAANSAGRLLTPGADVPDPVEISPEVVLLTDPAPFVENPAILMAVRDVEAVEQGAPELAGLIYLLHRWRVGFEVPAAREAPRASEIAETSQLLRGTRLRMVLTLIENPQPRNLAENSSGLTKIWEVFGSDSDGHLHRVDFIRKPKNLPRGADVVLEGDFLRLYRYRTLAGMDAMVPQWVAETLEPYQSPFVRKGNQLLPLWVIGILAVGTLLLLLMIQHRGPRPSSPRRRRS